MKNEAPSQRPDAAHGFSGVGKDFHHVARVWNCSPQVIERQLKDQCLTIIHMMFKSEIVL